MSDNEQVGNRQGAKKRRRSKKSEQMLQEAIRGLDLPDQYKGRTSLAVAEVHHLVMTSSVSAPPLPHVCVKYLGNGLCRKWYLDVKTNEYSIKSKEPPMNCDACQAAARRIA